MKGAFVIDTRDLPRQPGSMREVRMTVPAAHELGSEVIAIREGTPIDLDLRLEAVSEGVLVSGTAHAVATGECVRCLGEVVEDVEVEVTELFAYSGGRSERLAAQSAEGEDDPLPVLDGDLLDLEPTLTDAIVPALPFQPLCRPDCAGLCSVCGVRLDDAEPGHTHESIDPRWAALASLAGEGGDGDRADDAPGEAL